MMARRTLTVVGVPATSEAVGGCAAAPAVGVNGSAWGYHGRGRGCGTVRSLIGLWRWRHNPLRRTTDLVEAWLARWLDSLAAVAAPAPYSSPGAHQVLRT